MKTLLLLPLCTAFASAVLGADAHTDAEINRAAEIELAKIRAARMAEAKEKADAELEAKRVREAGISVLVKVFQVVPGKGFLAKPIGPGYTGPERLVEIPREEWVQGTGLDAHKRVKRTWVEQKMERKAVALGELFFVHHVATAGLVDDVTRQVTLWPTEAYHYSTAGNATKTVRAYRTQP